MCGYFGGSARLGCLNRIEISRRQDALHDLNALVGCKRLSQRFRGCFVGRIEMDLWPPAGSLQSCGRAFNGGRPVPARPDIRRVVKKQMQRGEGAVMNDRQREQLRQDADRGGRNDDADRAIVFGAPHGTQALERKRRQRRAGGIASEQRRQSGYRQVERSKQDRAESKECELEQSTPGTSKSPEIATNPGGDKAPARRALQTIIDGPPDGRAHQPCPIP